MKEKFRKFIEKARILGEDGDWSFHEFGFQKNTHYDILVIAPGWKPTKILIDKDFIINHTREHSYLNGFEVRGHGLTIAWAQVSPGACNLIDELSACHELNFDKLVFLGAVGGLKEGYKVGSICTPSYAIAGNYANAYLGEDLTKYQSFAKVYPPDTLLIDKVIDLGKSLHISIKKAPVFCTDSIFGEFYHLDFIKSFDVDLIEMETSSFYLMADLFEKPAIALLVVSDNSATGEPLLNKKKEQQEQYDHGRKVLIPQLLIEIGKMQLEKDGE